MEDRSEITVPPTGPSAACTWTGGVASNASRHFAAPPNMKRLCLAFVLAACSLADAAPLSLHPENPHYFLFRDKPTVLITSAEHYGAVLNLDFDYVKYLDTLAADGLNLTRTFTGAYVEP